MTKYACFLLVLLTKVGSGQPIQLKGNISGIADENLQMELPEDWFGQSWSGELIIESNGFWKQIEIPASGWLRLHYKDKDNRFYLWKRSESLTIDFESDFLDTDFKVSCKGSAIDSFASLVDEKFGTKRTSIRLEEQAKVAINIDAMDT